MRLSISPRPREQQEETSWNVKDSRSSLYLDLRDVRLVRKSRLDPTKSSVLY